MAHLHPYISILQFVFTSMASCRPRASPSVFRQMTPTCCESRSMVISGGCSTVTFQMTQLVASHAIEISEWRNSDNNNNQVKHDIEHIRGLQRVARKEFELAGSSKCGCQIQPTSSAQNGTDDNTELSTLCCRLPRGRAHRQHLLTPQPARLSECCFESEGGIDHRSLHKKALSRKRVHCLTSQTSSRLPT